MANRSQRCDGIAFLILIDGMRRYEAVATPASLDAMSADGKLRIGNFLQTYQQVTI